MLSKLSCWAPFTYSWFNPLYCAENVLAFSIALHSRGLSGEYIFASHNNVYIINSGWACTSKVELIFQKQLHKQLFFFFVPNLKYPPSMFRNMTNNSPVVPTHYPPILFRTRRGKLTDDAWSPWIDFPTFDACRWLSCWLT